MKKKHVKKLYKCQYCGKCLDKLISLREHLVTHRDEGFQCSICDVVLKRYISLSYHVERHHKIEKIRITCTCDLCGMKCYSTKQLDSHMIMKHKGLFKCLEMSCTSRFGTENSAKFHFLSMHRRDAKVRCYHSDNFLFCTETLFYLFRITIV